MTKKESKKGSSKNHSLDKDSCGLSCLKEVDIQYINDKKANVNNNSANIQSTYSTPRESIPKIFNNLQYIKEPIHRPQSAPQIQTTKSQNYQPPRSSRRTLERQDTPRPRSETPPIVRKETCESKVHSKSKLKGITRRLFEAFQGRSRSRGSHMSHHRLHHKSWSPRSGRSMSPRGAMTRYGSIPRSPKRYCQYHRTNSKNDHQCSEKRCKSRACGLCIIS